MPRTLKAIARDISKEWKRPNDRAHLYLIALKKLKSPKDRYVIIKGTDVIRHFLNESRFWTGERATELKDELKAILEEEEDGTS